MTGAPGGGPPRSLLAFVLVVSGTVLGIAGTDLVLPAVRRRLLARLGLALTRCPCCKADLRPLLPSGVPR